MHMVENGPTMPFPPRPATSWLRLVPVSERAIRAVGKRHAAENQPIP